MAKEPTLRERVIILEAAFRREAVSFDAAFLRTNPQAVEDGAYDGIADKHRRWANKLRALASEMIGRAGPSTVPQAFDDGRPSPLVT